MTADDAEEPEFVTPVTENTKTPPNSPDIEAEASGAVAVLPPAATPSSPTRVTVQSLRVDCVDPWRGYKEMPDLGFNSRTERDKWRAGGVVSVPSVLKDVGPGSYEIGARRSVVDRKPGFAPFLSTAERKLGPETGSDLPGPGHYNSNCVLHTSQRGRATDVFRSGTRRFESHNRRANETPGPGAYLVYKDFRRKDQASTGNASRGETDRIKWVRVPTAPSIPRREQSYGYEEGIEGELVMQRPADLGHSGRGDDCPGPVDYKPKVDITRRKPAATDFSKGEDRLVALCRARTSTTPGPGHYNAAKGLGDPDEGIDIRRTISYRKRQRPSASFHYGANRERPRKAQDIMPGPGDYRIPCGLNVKRDPGRRDLSFLSTSRRFEEPSTGGGGRNRAPGPGSYGAVPSDFDRNYQANQRRARGNTCALPVGFQSTSLRFLDRSERDPGLDPAKYSMIGMAQETIRKGTGTGKRAGAFGSTAKRFPARGVGQPTLPGPGHYNLQVGGGSLVEDEACSRSPAVDGTWGKRLPRALSIFVSATKRFPPTSSAIPGPAPGQYKVLLREKPRGVLEIGKQSKNRFESAATPGLGPGSYNVRDPEQFGRARSRKDIMISSQTRFADPTKLRLDDSPGPGHYSSNMVYGNLLKQTYNIVIAEQSAKVF